VLKLADAEDDLTAFGFTWGPMTVTRMASYERRKGFRTHVLGIKTNRADVQVYVTPTGLVRVWKNGQECVIPPAVTDGGDA
jgi:hypothetical protein